MNKYEIIKKIENFAPLETQESWDCSGWIVNTKKQDINKILLCLTVTEMVVNQALEQNCDMIISHHPCFCVPLNWEKIDIYCAHTNMDKTKGGTTDSLINKLGLSEFKIQNEHQYLRFIEKSFSIKDFSNIIKKISPDARIVNNKNIKQINKIAFCAGSGSEFINDAKEFGADCLVTGDLKFHVALDSEIVVFDIGHFESEIIILPIFEKIIGKDVKFVYANEESPFKML